MKKQDLQKCCILQTVLLLLSLAGCSLQTEPLLTHPIPAIERAAQGNAAAKMPEEEPEPSFDCAQSVTLLTEQGTQQLSLREYLMGVLTAELPGSFAPEAMKAQAIAARTLTLKALESGEALYADPDRFQAWSPFAGNETIRAAVEQTDGQVLTCNGALIEATFFSCSGGMTEAAVEVWGHEVSYLQAVESPGEEAAPRYAETLTFALSTVQRLLKEADERFDPALPLIGAQEMTVGGGVRTMELGGVTFPGAELRRILSLRSTMFTVEQDGSAVHIHTLGFGHRVGMSQYGAQAMAEQGRSAEEILSHYYPGTVLERKKASEQCSEAFLDGLITAGSGQRPER